MINHRLMSLMENAKYVDEKGNPVEVDEKLLQNDEDGNLIFNDIKVKKVDNESTTNQPKPFNLDTNRFGPDKDPSSTPPAPSTPKPSDTKEPEKPSTPEVPQPNVDPSGLANQAGPGSAAMANQLAQAGVGAGGGQPNQSGGVNLNFANMFAGQFAKGPVNVGGNQQVSSGSGAQTMNFGTMASGGAVISGGGISGKVATGFGKIDSGNTNNNSGNTNTNSGNTTRNINSNNTNTNSGNTTNTNSGNTTTNRNVAIGGSSIAANQSGVNTKPAPKKASTKPPTAQATVKEDFQLKVNQTLNEMNRLFGRKDGGLRKS